MTELLENLGINGKLLFAQIFNFLLVFWLLQKFVFGKLLVFIDRRKREIAEGLELRARAEKEVARTKVLQEEVLDRARAEAQKQLTDAKKRSAAAERESTLQAKEKAASIVEAGKEQAAREQELALQRLQQEVGQMALAAAERILQRNLTKKDQQRLVEGMLTSVKKGYASGK